MQHAPQPRYNVELVKASDLEGNPYYAYLLLPETLVSVFREKLKIEDVDLKQYGVILAQGIGHVPSQEHIDYIQQRFTTSAT